MRHSMRLYGVGPHRSRPGPPALLLGYASLTEPDIDVAVALPAAVLAAAKRTTTCSSARRRRIWDPAERSLEARLAGTPPTD